MKKQDYSRSGWDVDINIEDTARLFTESRAGRLKKQKILLITSAVAVFLVVGIVGYMIIDGKKSNDQIETDEKNLQEEIIDNSEVDDMSDIYESYAEVLRDNMDGIKAYYWQLRSDGKPWNEYSYGVVPDTELYVLENPRNPCVAVTDLNGDSKPELIFMKADSYYGAELHIYTYVDGKAVESDYSISGKYDSGPLRDQQAASGTTYMIYKGKEKGTFSFAHCIGDESFSYDINKMHMDTDGNIDEINHIENITGVDYSNDDYVTTDEYFINGSKVNQSKGIEAFRSANDEYDQLIMYSDNASDVMSIFKHVETDAPIAMTYDQAMQYLQG